MDPKANMPDIKAEIQRRRDEKKKSSGLLGSLFGGGGGTGAAGGVGGVGGLGGLGGAGGVGGLFTGGGILATKAGMIALVVMGSAVAGGLGLAGFKIFGPGEADRAGGGNISLFQPRPKEADASAVAPVAADGSSASLNYMAQAAAKDREAEAPPTDQTAASAAADKAAADKAAADEAAKAAAAAAASGNAPINAGSGGHGAVGSMAGAKPGALQGTKKLGALSGVTGGGSSSASASAGKVGEVAVAARNGQTTAFNRSSGGSAKASNNAGRGIASRRGSGARNQLAQVMRDQRGAGSSMAAGRTYDGGGTSGGNDIGSGNAIGSDGVGSGDGVQPKEVGANRAANTRSDEYIPEPPPKDVTPWANEIMIGMGLGVAAIALLYFASTMIKEAKTTVLAGQAALETALAASPIGWAAVDAAIAMIEEGMAQLQLAKVVIGAGIAAALGGAVMGGMIAGGENGQTLQGGLLIASSLMIGTIGALMMKSACAVAMPEDGWGLEADTHMAAFEAPPTWMYLIGGVAAVGLVGTMMAPKKTCKSNEEGCHAYYQRHALPNSDRTV